jgi:hypothetical protein
MPFMTGTETTGKPSVLVWMIDMKSAIVRSPVPNPPVISRLHVRRVRVARLVAEILFATVVRFASRTRLLIAGIWLRLRSPVILRSSGGGVLLRSPVILRSSGRGALLRSPAFRAMLRDVSPADLGSLTPPMFLGRNDQGKAQQTGGNHHKSLHNRRTEWMRLDATE